jgi:hypothetical protein
VQVWPAYRATFGQIGSDELTPELQRGFRTFMELKVLWPMPASKAPPVDDDNFEFDKKFLGSRDAGDTINASGASVMFVGLGRPKQELWMARHGGQRPYISSKRTISSSPRYDPD